MKSKVFGLKLRALCALALVFAGVAVVCFTGCGKTKPKELDYKTASYQTMKSDDWNSKDVTYQFLNDRFDGYGSSWPVCLNLYSDGSAASWQSTVTGFHVNHWANQDKYVIWDFY